MYKKLFFLFFFNCYISFAQEPCATDKHQKVLFENDSIAYQNYLASEKLLLEKMLEKKAVDERLLKKNDLKKSKKSKRIKKNRVKNNP